jgi:hypothetical protein
LMQHTSKFIALTQTDVDLWRIGRKISDLRGRKARTECMTLGEIISKPDVATPTETRVGAEVKKNLFIACSMKETPTIGQGIVPFSWNLKRR